jgi:hypothetical protein
MVDQGGGSVAADCSWVNTIEHKLTIKGVHCPYPHAKKLHSTDSFRIKLEL